MSTVLFVVCLCVMAFVSGHLMTYKYSEDAEAIGGSLLVIFLIGLLVLSLKTEYSWWVKVVITLLVVASYLLAILLWKPKLEPTPAKAEVRSPPPKKEPEEIRREAFLQ